MIGRDVQKVSVKHGSYIRVHQCNFHLKNTDCAVINNPSLNVNSVSSKAKK